MSDVAQSDWRVDMLRSATAAGARVSASERARNPLIPNNFFDLSEAGFPSDVQVMMIPIPAKGSPAQMSQYHNATAVLGWSHVRWDWISENGGLDGKASVPGASAHDLGNGEYVASLSGYYLMFADKKQYEARRAQNLERANRRIEERVAAVEEDKGGNSRTFGHIDDPQTLSVDDLLEYESRLSFRKGESATQEG